MLQENEDYLKEVLKYLGFGENNPLIRQLEEEMRKNKPSFELYTEAFYEANKKMEAKLYFRKSNTSDIVFFNKYDALLRYQGQPDNDRGQTFYIDKGRGISLKEAYNLLDGRSVFKNLVSKSGEKYQSWLQLDFDAAKDKHGNYRYQSYNAGYKYDLEATLRKHAFAELNDPTKFQWMMRSLERGNLHLASLEVNGKQEKVYVAALPKYKDLVILNENRLPLEKGKRQAGTPSAETKKDETEAENKGKSRAAKKADLDNEDVSKPNKNNRRK